jgi:tetratricopeptide (TPR) repeat protein
LVGTQRAGVTLSAKGHFTEAVAPLNQALAACDAAGDQRNHCVALVRSNLCLALTKLNRIDDAVSTCTLSLNALRQDRSPGTRQQLFYGDFHLADLQHKLHRDSDAEALFNDAIAIGLKPGSTIPEVDVGNTLIHLASIHRDQGRLEVAAAELRDAATRTRASNIAVAIQSLGLLQDTLWKLLRYDEAGAAARDALKLAESQAAPGYSEMYSAMNTVARQDIFMDKLTDAEKMVRQCLEHLREYTVLENPNIMAQQWELAEILEDEGRASEALDVERQILGWFDLYNPKSQLCPTG